MSLSREIALIANDEEKCREAMSAIAKNLLRSGRAMGRRSFDRVLRPLMHGLHAGGFDKGKRKDLQHVARNEFRKAKAAMFPLALQEAR